MEIEDIYQGRKPHLECDVICVKIKGWPDVILLENHVDNRRLMREFNKQKAWKKDNKPLTGIELAFFEESLKNEEEKRFYNGKDKTYSSG